MTCNDEIAVQRKTKARIEAREKETKQESLTKDKRQKILRPSLQLVLLGPKMQIRDPQASIRGHNIQNTRVSSFINEMARCTTRAHSLVRCLIHSSQQPQCIYKTTSLIWQ